ncbi:MAG: hypothetical protein LBP26_03160, partial [Clostridiales bacterium]|nr:hypothetical protein [Clostridiales bacterium]
TLSDKNEVTQELEQQDGAVKRLKVKYEVISKRLQELKQKRDSLSLAMQQDIDSLKNSEAKFSKKGGKLFENYDITAQSRVG